MHIFNYFYFLYFPNTRILIFLNIKITLKTQLMLKKKKILIYLKKYNNKKFNEMQYISKAI